MRRIRLSSSSHRGYREYREYQKSASPPTRHGDDGDDVPLTWTAWIGRAAHHLMRNKRKTNRSLLYCLIVIPSCLLVLALLGWYSRRPPTTTVQQEGQEQEQVNLHTNFKIDNNDTQWQKYISDLEHSSHKLFHHWFIKDEHRLFDLPDGIPGTGIDTFQEAKQLQDYLNCKNSRGKWIKDITGRDHLQSQGGVIPIHKQSPAYTACDKSFHVQEGSTDWPVRDSLKWYWQASPECEDLYDTSPSIANISSTTTTPPILPDRKLLCSYLGKKNILLVGDAPTQYLIHDLILDWSSTKPLTCYGDLYCKEHVICSDDILNLDNTHPWENDIHVYKTLPRAPLIAVDNSNIKHDNITPDSSSNNPLASPSAPAVKSDNSRSSAILRYRRSDSMFFNASPSHPRHHPVYINPNSGVRQINMYALADARRSDVIILSKAPIPWPQSTSSGTSLNKKLIKLANSASNSAAIQPLDSFNLVKEIAMLSTQEIWLPEVMESIRALKAPPAPKDFLIVYRGGWQIQERNCRNTKKDLNGFQRSLDLNALLYNMQTLMQNHIISKVIAPRLGIAYIDMDSMATDWQFPFTGRKRTGSTGAVMASEDCMRRCLPSTGYSLETAFLISLQDIFKRGWYAFGRYETWIGKSFVPVKERTKLDANKSL